MPSKSVILLYLCLFLNSVTSAQLPSSFQRCESKQSDFKQCLTRAVNDALHQLTKPIPEVGLPSIEPFLTTVESIPAGKSTLRFEQKYKNFTLHGLTTGEVLNVNYENNTINLEVAYEKVWASFTYEFNGKLFLIDVGGANSGTATGINFTFLLTFNLEEYDKDGKKYYKVVNNDVVATEPKGFVFNLTDLLRTDLDLGLGGLGAVTEIVDPNVLINQNFLQVFYDIKRGYEVAYAKDFKILFNGFLQHVSASELFGDE